MKFKIEKYELTTKTNVWGKPLSEMELYFVYRSVLCGLKRLYVKVTPKYNKCALAHEYMISYVPRSLASQFDRETAERLIEHMKEEPDRFVRYLD